jgi:tetratricopeptide (TPR) repeat protein
LVGIAVLVVWFLIQARNEVPSELDELIAAQRALDADKPDAKQSLDHLARIRASGPVIQGRVKVAEGKAHYLLMAYDQAEACWIEALRQDPKVPEAAWALLDLYYLEGRAPEASDLALRQHAVEPDPRDRVRLLVELLRQDAEPPDPASIVARFEMVVRAGPAEFHPRLALGTALVRSSRISEGIEVLGAAASEFRDRVEAWYAWLDGLDTAGLQDQLDQSWTQVPTTIRGDRRLARLEGAIAWARGDPATAAVAYQRAWRNRADDLTAAYRLARALHALGRHDEAAEIDRFNEAASVARTEVPELYRAINAVNDLGVHPYPDLYHRLAANRERLGRWREARAWHRLVLEHLPQDTLSIQALKRIESKISTSGSHDA